MRRYRRNFLSETPQRGVKPPNLFYQYSNLELFDQVTMIIL